MPLDQRIIDLYDEYTHKPLPRRVFLERLAVVAGSGGAATAALSVLEPNYARAALVPESDPRVKAGMVTTTVEGTEITGYLAAPSAGGKVPGVVVFHENRGLNPHIEDVARRLAAAGFVAFAVDFLHPLGGTPDNDDKARELFGKLDGETVVRQAHAALVMLQKDPRTNGKVGAVGFCWGGGMVNIFATREPQLGAGVAFYGVAPPAEAVARIKAPMMLHFAGLDTRVNAGMPGYDAALKAAKVPHEIFVYDGVNHAFHNDTSAERYNKEAATLAFSRTVEFLKKNLG